MRTVTFTCDECHSAIPDGSGFVVGSGKEQDCNLFLSITSRTTGTPYHADNHTHLCSEPCVMKHIERWLPDLHKEKP